MRDETYDYFTDVDFKDWDIRISEKSKTEAKKLADSADGHFDSFLKVCSENAGLMDLFITTYTSRV
jgi:hypothetical protein